MKEIIMEKKPRDFVTMADARRDKALREKEAIAKAQAEKEAKKGKK